MSQRKRTEALFQQYSELDEGIRQQMEAAMSDIHVVVGWILQQKGEAIPVGPPEVVEAVKETARKIFESC